MKTQQQDLETHLSESLPQLDQESTTRVCSRKLLEKLHLILRVIKRVKKSKDSVAPLITQVGNRKFSQIDPKKNKLELYGLILTPKTLANFLHRMIQ